jgi:hypothetical protein
MDVQAQAKRKKIFPFSPFGSLQTLNGLDNDPLNLWWQSLPSPLIHILICSKNTFTDTLRSNILPVAWASLSLVTWIQKMSHCSRFLTKSEEEIHECKNCWVCPKEAYK